MAAARICLCGCGREIPASARPHKVAFDAACRKRIERTHEPRVELPILEHEPEVIAEVRGRKLTPEEAILWVVFPETMRDRIAYVLDVAA
jgi:hypothetical protein